MGRTIKISPPNSILFISDGRSGVAPQITKEKRIWATSSCVAVGCLMEQDGPTEVTLGQADEIRSQEIPAFDGFLETPRRTVLVSTSENRSILEKNVTSERTRLRIWTNHPSEPDKVIIALG